jgi:hypothetical protein
VEEKAIWFCEPSSADNTFLRYGERTFDWLARSTNERATAVRRFLNVNIAQVPSPWRDRLYEAFRSKDWDATLFELFVARALQLLGASIEVEVALEATGRKPDFLAHFPDLSVIVEATVRETNSDLRRQIDQNEALIGIIEALVPDGWSVAVWRLPKLGPSDSKQPFKQAVQRLFTAHAGGQTQSGRVDISEEFDSGEISMTIFPGPTGVITRGVASSWDDTEYRIPQAFRGKKKQVGKASLPVVLALTTWSMGDDLGDFDRALFGKTYERVGFFGETLETGFTADGLFSKKRAEPPTYAAALVFPRIAFRDVPDPVLYLNSRFDGSLPKALTELQVRMYQEEGVGTRQAQSERILERMQFVSSDV